MGLRIGSWPGFGDHNNKFMELFLGGLRDADCEIISIETVNDIPTSGLDVLILHWAEKLFWEARDRWDILARILTLINRLKQIRPKTKVVWLVHNLQPHEPRKFKNLIWPFYIRTLARNIDAALTLSPGTVPVVREHLGALKHKPVAWAWHPAYPRLCQGTHNAGAARSARGWETEHYVFGYCGQIRPYKGVDDLINVFLRSENPSWRLLIAGRASSSEFEDILEDKAVADPRIRLEFGDMSEVEYEMAILCCDTIVAPFRKYLHSGSLVHAMSVGRQVLTPRTPFSNALAKQVGRDWVALYDGPLSVDALQEAEQGRNESDNADLSEFDPKRVGEQIVAFFQSL
ncbi:glycosyltransferase [Roseovarius sp. 217]|uniref:glycosyltransferase n=1 Tax=Roseovarius sp. (strain 217) TaxID=314264 RepID=UPI0003218945|nr:glycosyltransferase [Roseovarius sp. 217]